MGGCEGRGPTSVGRAPRTPVWFFIRVHATTRGIGSKQFKIRNQGRPSPPCAAAAPDARSRCRPQRRYGQLPRFLCLVTRNVSMTTTYRFGTLKLRTQTKVRLLEMVGRAVDPQCAVDQDSDGYRLRIENSAFFLPRVTCPGACAPLPLWLPVSGRQCRRRESRRQGSQCSLSRQSLLCLSPLPV